jgi:hypothetical protein
MQAARISFVSAVFFLILLATLHIIESEIDPSWHFISEYELGKFGWMMVLAFLSLATSCGALFFALKAQLKTITGYIGLALLGISTVGFLLAAFFQTDPITAGVDNLTTHGQIHATGALLSGGLSFAALFICLSLVRKNQSWCFVRGWVIAATVLILIGEAVMDISLGIMTPKDGKFGPSILIGWSSRFIMITYALWLVTVSVQAIKVYKKNGEEVNNNDKK